jgi:phosphomannomutase / phosphoglucomutase
MTNSKTHGPTTNTVSKLKQHPFVLASLVLIICCFAWLSFVLHHNLLDNTKYDIAYANANNYAQQQLITANTYLQQRQEQLQSLSEKDLFVDALASGDNKKIEHMERLMADWVDGLFLGYLLGPQDTRLNLAHNFAGQKITQKVFSGEKTTPSAAYINGSWQLIFAYPLVNDRSSNRNDENNILGVMLVMLGTESLSSLLKNVDNSFGTTELFQKLPNIRGKSVIALKNKNQAIEKISLKTRIPYWEIHYTGSTALLDQAQPSYREFIIIQSALLAFMLLLLYVTIRFTLHYHKDKSPRLKPGKNIKKTQVNDEEAIDETRESYLQVLPSSGEQPSADNTQPKEPDTQTSNEVTDKNIAEKPSIPSVVFRDYDIRGLADTELTPEFARRLGQVLANKVQALGEHSLIVGSDGRNSSPKLTEALEQGILSTGCHVIHLGQVPTPLLNFATHQLSETDCGIMVTASHNPAEYNGFKMFFKRHALCGEEIMSLKTELEQSFPNVNPGELETCDLLSEYVESVANDMVPAENLKVVLDAGNGIAGELGCNVLEAIGCDVIPLYCDVDGDFPNHPPDTSVADNLADLIACVKESNADMGIALDGDGDRVVAISSSGKIIWPDELLMIFARDVASRHPGADIVFDVKSTNRLNSLISSYGGRPVMWKTGHSHMYNKILACEAPVGGEYSGHIFFHDRWHGFDDGIYAAARLVEIMAIREQGLDEMMASFESRHSTPEIKIHVAEEDKFGIMDKLITEHTFKDGKISTIDGLRVELPDSWGLVRASNTSPALTLRFEANSTESLNNIQSLFKQQLENIDNNLTF